MHLRNNVSSFLVRVERIIFADAQDMRLHSLGPSYSKLIHLLKPIKSSVLIGFAGKLTAAELLTFFWQKMAVFVHTTYLNFN